MAQVQSMAGSTYQYRSTWDAVRALTAQRGAAGLMRGYWATNAVWLPWNAIYIASYESSKRAAARALGLAPAAGASSSGADAQGIAPRV